MTLSGLEGTTRLTAVIALRRASTTTRTTMSRSSRARTTYIVPSRCGGDSGEKPAARRSLLTSSGGSRAVKAPSAATGAGSVDRGSAWPRATATTRQIRQSAAAPNIRAITELPMTTLVSEAIAACWALSEDRFQEPVSNLAPVLKRWFDGFEAG
jgi:hypothetical protein